MSLDESLHRSLEERRAASQYRVRRVMQAPQGPLAVIDGKHYLNFCSNDYLGLANHPEVINAFKQAADDYGVGSGASHLINGHSQAHHALEEELAAFCKRPRALLFSTGYMANLGVVSALMGRGDHLFEDRLNHASLLDAGLLAQARLQRFQHCDADDLENKLKASKALHKLIVSDGVFSMDGDLAEVPTLVAQAQQHDATIMIDDAHGLGVIGANGRGTLEHFGMDEQQVPILVGTLGKAFGTFGAFVAGSEALIETLIQQARSYIYTTALPPAVAAATRTSLRLVQTESWRRDRLQALVDYFKQGAAERGLPVMASSTPIQPILVGDNQQAVHLSEALLAAGVMVSAIRPPTVPEGTARLRVTLSVGHEEPQLEQLLDTLQRAYSQIRRDGN